MLGACSCSTAGARCCSSAHCQETGEGPGQGPALLPTPSSPGTAIKTVLHCNVDPWFFFILPCSFLLPPNLRACRSGLLECPTVVPLEHLVGLLSVLQLMMRVPAGSCRAHPTELPLLSHHQQTQYIPKAHFKYVKVPSVSCRSSSKCFAK